MVNNYYLCNRWRNLFILIKIRIEVECPTIVLDFNFKKINKNGKRNFFRERQRAF